MMAIPKEKRLNDLRITFAKNRHSMGVYSFAGDPRSIQMWSHYAANHTGLCLQFDVARDPMKFLGAVRVHYEPDYPTVNWMVNIEEQLGDALLRKHPGWTYEQERRIIKPNRAGSYEPFRPNALTGIIFGCRSSELLVETIRSLLDQRTKLGYSAVRMYKARMHQSEYALQIARM